jgi:hypothetical protein
LGRKRGVGERNEDIGRRRNRRRNIGKKRRV